MKKFGIKSASCIVGAVLFIAGSFTALGQTTIYADNFNVANTANFDGASLAGRLSGTLASTVVPKSGGIELTISSDALNLLAVTAGTSDGRMRFEPTSLVGIYDWSSGAAGAAITASGGMVVSFNWTSADNTSANWISYCVGMAPGVDQSLQILKTTTASGILLRNNGGAQVFKQGTGGATGTFGVTSTSHLVTLYYYFASWASGTPVTLNAYVDGNLVATQTFTWIQTGGVQNMAISSVASGSVIDNFSVTTLPPTPPSIAANTSSDSPATNYAGRTINLTASIAGTAPITNQWQVNTGSGFVNISNATNSTLSLVNVQTTNSGSYQLLGSNPAGSTNSAPLQITVINAPATNLLNLQFTGFTGGGTPAATQTGPAVIGNTGDNWTTVFSTGGSFTAGTGGTAANPTPLYLNDSSSNGTAISLSYIADYLYNAGTGPFASSPVAGLMSGVIAVQSARTGTLTFSNLASGNYDLYVYGQNSGSQTRSSTYVANGMSAVCGPNSSVNMLASPTNYVHLVPTVTSNGVLTLTFTGAADGNAQINGLQLSGPQVLPTLALGADTTVTPATTVYAGFSPVIFSANFVGTQPITNQWEVNTGSGFVPITGATNTTLTLTNVQVSSSGSYALFSSNLAGNLNSTPMTFTVLTAPTNISFNVQFTGSWLSSGNAPTQSGSAVIGNGGDVWNTISNPTGGTSPAGLAIGTNITVVDVGNIPTTITMGYVADYVFNGLAFGNSNPFASVASPYANLMSGYMGSVSQGSTADTNTVTLSNLLPGSYDVYLYACGRNDGQTRVNVYAANGASAVCGPNSGNYALTPGVNYVHLTPTVTTNGLLVITDYGTADSGQGLLNGIQINGPVTLPTLSLSSDTTSDSPANDYVGRNVNFSASFAGYPPPSLQWEVNNGSGYVNVANATNSTLTLTGVQTTNSGSYALFATNLAGALNSTPVSLTVLPLPVTNLQVNVQFIGTSRGSGFADTQVGPGVIGNGGDLWNPVSNPNPVATDTNPISGTILGLADATDIGTSIVLSYTGNTILNSGTGTPFNGSGSPAADLMEACLGVANTRTATVTVQGLQPGIYDVYLYSSAGNGLQTEVSHFTANDGTDYAGPNSGINVLTLETNYVHLTPTVNSNGVLNISFIGNVTGQSSLNGIQLAGPGAAPLPPTAGFTGAPTNTFATQPVVFTDASIGSITNWLWNFGDGSTVTNASSTGVTHAYAAPGAYAVSLTVSGSGGSNTDTQSGYIMVNGVPSFGSPVLSGGNLILGGTGGSAGAQYRILTTTNLALPLGSWIPIWTNVFAPDGSYSYTNSPLSNSASFFRLVSP